MFLLFVVVLLLMSMLVSEWFIVLYMICVRMSLFVLMRELVMMSRLFLSMKLVVVVVMLE